jgi:hypothetical protein
MSDPELDAMQEIHKAFEKLKDEDARGRVLRWTVGRYGGVSKAQEKLRSPLAPEIGLIAGQFSDFASLFTATNPATEAEQALVAGYWYQVCQTSPDFDSQTINTELKQHGHGVGNITRALDTLISQEPRLVIQVRKAGTSKQARKRYKLTTEGISRVKQMMTGATGGV